MLMIISQIGFVIQIILVLYFIWHSDLDISLKLLFSVLIVWVTLIVSVLVFVVCLF